MNFGQAMLYGAFGQLTGMMGGGCFGGGYGMGSYGMGMGGSLFSMMGMGGYGFGAGCCGMYNYSVPDSYVGAQCGLTAMNVLFQGIGGAISARKADKAAAQENSAANQLTKLNEDAKTHLDTLGLSSLEKFNPSDTADKYKNEYVATFNAADEAITKRQTEINKAKQDLGDRPTSVPADAPEGTTLASLQTDYDNKKTALETEYKKLTEKTDTSNALVKAYKDAETKKNEREKAINDAITALKPLKTKYDELNEQARVENNNNNAKLERKCDNAVDSSTKKQTEEMRQFNDAYDAFKDSQTQEKLDDLIEKYNAIKGNKKSFTRLLEQLQKQHSNLDFSEMN